MKNSVSEQSWYIESEEEAEEQDLNKEDDDQNDSYFSDSSTDSQNQNKHGSFVTSWPQSYRQSIDMLGSVPSPGIGFLGTPSLTQLGSSFLSSTLTRRHTPESLQSETKPLLLPTTVIADDKWRSSHSLLPPFPSRIRASARRDEKSSKVSHELPSSRQSSYAQAVLNGMNVLCGVGILSTPFAVKEGGWIGLSILLTFALLSFYTGILLRRCLDSQPGLETYPDIGHAAFGTYGRIIISIVLYVELYAACIEYIILESDNLSSLFPNAHITLGHLEFKSHLLFAIMTAIAVLPTVCLRDLSILSYISAGGVMASVLVVLCLFWTGLVDGVGFQSQGSVLNLSTLPVSIGLYGFCYSGHAVFPNIYTSMAKPSQYPSVLLTWLAGCIFSVRIFALLLYSWLLVLQNPVVILIFDFVICTMMYAGVGVMGYLMFGESTLSQFTLNMPQDLVASKIAVWTTVVNPFTKYALTISPVAMSLEELIPSNHAKSHIYSILIRTSLVVSTLFVGLAIPFFGLVMSLIGSLLTMLVTLILPCACFLRILKGKVTLLQAVICVVIITVGVVSSIFGTYSAVSKIIQNLSS